MTERTTDPDAWRLEAVKEFEEKTDRAVAEARRLWPHDPQVMMPTHMATAVRDTLAALRERAERAEAERDEARALVKSAWCEGHNIGLGDGHPLAGPPHRWEDSDACADLAALSDSPAPEVRGG